IKRALVGRGRDHTRHWNDIQIALELLLCVFDEQFLHPQAQGRLADTGTAKQVNHAAVTDVVDGLVEVFFRLHQFGLHHAPVAEVGIPFHRRRIEQVWREAAVACCGHSVRSPYCSSSFTATGGRAVLTVASASPSLAGSHASGASPWERPKMEVRMWCA